MTECRCKECGSILPNAAGLVVDTGAKTVAYRGQVARLTSTWVQIAEKLASRPGRVFRKGELFDHLYGLRPDADQPECDLAILGVFIARLRPRLASIGLSIRTVWGEGWALDLPPEPAQ